MISLNDHNQLLLFDPWNFLEPKRRYVLDNSWAGFLQKEILRNLPVKELIPTFSKIVGRPSKELYTMLGIMVLQQAHDLTDNETIYQFSFNTPWHYALNITDESDASKYVSLKTLWNFRQIMIEKKLDSVLFEKITAKPCKKYYYFRYNKKSARVAIRRANEQTDEFKNRYRWRAGVEAAMSEYDRLTGVKQLRFRGFKSVRFAAILKVIGVNIFRATAVRKAIGYA